MDRDSTRQRTWPAPAPARKKGSALRAGLVLSLSLSLALASVPALPVAADDITDLAAHVAAAGHDVPPAAVLRHACDTDPLCVARFLKDRIGPGAALLPVTGSEPRSRGWSTRPALQRVINDLQGGLFIVPARFDTAAIVRAVTEAQGQGAPVRRLVLDLREIDDAGNVDGMRRVAALFTGRHDRAFRLHHTGGRVVDWVIPKPARPLGPFAIEVWTDAGIDAATEAFGALLRHYADAKVLGVPSQTGGYLKKTIAVMPGWALQVPTGQITIPGADLSAGLIPDAPIPE